jgi:hypothetical protein
MERDFTLSVYKDLIGECKKAGFKVLSLNEYFKKRRNKEAFVILRHDVDRKPENALKMALLESSFQIHSTYYFRVNKSVFNKEIIRKISELGHEIGYHYEVLDKAHGDIKLAESIFDSELNSLRTLADISTACMHGNPLSRRDNREFWNHFSFSRFNLIGEAYLSIHDPDLYYATDTGRGWNRSMFNLKDVFPDSSIRRLPSFSATRQLIGHISKKKYNKIYLQIHPNRWSWRRLQWYRQLGEDICSNWIKLFLSYYRKYKRK